MPRLENKGNLQVRDWLLCILAFSIPLPFIYSAVSIIIVSCFFIFSGACKDMFQRLKNHKILLLWILFYALHGISYLYSTDKAQSSFDIESKMSFAVLPIIIGAGNIIDRRRLEAILSAFIFGLVAVSIFCISKALLEYIHTGDSSPLFYHDLVRGLDANAVYVAWYTIFSLSVLLLLPWRYSIIGSKKWLGYSILVLLTIFFILLSARMLMVLFAIFIIPIYLYRLYTNPVTSSYKKWGVAILIVVGVVLMIIVPNPITYRFKELKGKQYASSFEKDYKSSEQQFSNFTLRLFLWRVGYENIKEHNLWVAGAGNGDVSLLQNKKMSELGIKDLYNTEHRSHLYNVNLHNMFIQTMMMLGFIGLSVFIALMFAPYFLLQRNVESLLYFIFQTIAIFFMMQEAALQTQAGIVFFLFFTSLFLNYMYAKKKDVNTVNQM